MANRKIKHYRNGYLIRKRRRNKFFKILLFIISIALLIFLGYTIAKSINHIDKSNKDESSSQIESTVEESSEQIIDFKTESSEITKSDNIRSILLTPEDMTLQKAEAFIKTVDKSLYNSITVELKNKSGQLLYHSESDLAKKCEAISEYAINHKKLAELITEYDFTPIARIYALQDDYASHSLYGTSYIYNDDMSVTWLDNSPDAGGKSWLNPYMNKTIDYLNIITEEIASAGYKTIIVNGIQYPNTGNQKGMSMGPENDSMTTKEALENVLSNITDTAKKYNTSVIPAYRGICYKDELPQVYTVNPNEFKTYPASPIIESDISILQYVIASANNTIPTISNSELIQTLKENGIDQYIVG